jgi:hypothetical protein
MVDQFRWALVLANLQQGAIDEAERWVQMAAVNQADEATGVLTFSLGARAEISLARGEVETGLYLWRRAVDGLKNVDAPMSSIDPGLDPWALELQAVAVTAHAHHARTDLVEEITAELPVRLTTMLTNPLVQPPAYLMDLAVCGTLLLALAMVELDRGVRTGDERASRSGARMIALAERFRFLRGFQPTMSSARARHAAGQADRSAYDDAVTSYADLGRDELRAAALAALRER